MAQSKGLPSWVGIACTWIGAGVAILAVIAMVAGPKATFTPDMRTVEIFSQRLGKASIVAVGVSAALMITGAWLGRQRKRRVAEHLHLIAAQAPDQEIEDLREKEPGRRRY